MVTNLLVIVAALLIEATCGYPALLFRAIGHPVVWIGALIGTLDRVLNRDTARQTVRRGCGVIAVAVLVGMAGFAGWCLAQAGVIVASVLAGSLLAQRSLHAHVRDVADALDERGLDGGRLAVARIVGRNPQTLDHAGVARAAIESLAENFSDGVVAPAFWCAVAGLPGVVAYKAINTADSMIGHRTKRHEAFGWAAARLDDLVNLPASRLAALLLALAAPPRFGDAMAALWRDAGKHRSPNAGWPEAAAAGALGLRLAGPRVYGSTRVADAWMGHGRAEATTADIRRALALYRRACALHWAVLVGLLLIARS